MDKREFGTWGIELIDEDFACALAALGVLQHWIGRDFYPLNFLHHRDNDTIDGQLASAAEVQRQGEQVIVGWNVWAPPGSYPSSPPAGEFADAWRRFIKQYQSQDSEGQPLETLQIQINQAASEDSFWLVEQLGRPEVGAASVYCPDSDLNKEYEVTWNWPLVVGFLPDRASQELREALEAVVEEVDYLKRLTMFVNLSSGNGTCDLLLLPHDLHAALATILQSEWQAQADCVVVLGRIKGRRENALILMAALWLQVQTAGIALNQVSRRHHADWFKELIRELSHNKSLDRALFTASRSLKAAVPLIFASRQLVEFSTVSRRIETLKDRFRSDAARGLKMNVLERVAYRLGIAEGEHDLGTVGDVLDGMIKNGLSYDHESDTASTTAELESASSPALDTVPPPEPQERWIQSKVIDARNPGEPTRLQSAFRANAPHSVFIRIGERSDEWLAPDADQPGTSFPAHELPAEETSHELTVVFSEPNILSEPLVDKISLPRSGNSSECHFLIHTKEAKQIEARVIVLHKNRVLQTALLRAPVVDDPVEANNSHIELSIEAVVRPGFQGLSDRRKFDVALVLNHNGERVAAATAATEDGAAYIRLPNLESAIAGFDDQLSDIAKDPDKYAGLNNQATVDLLRDFAQKGSMLYRRIIQDNRNRIGDTIARAGRIQVVTAEAEARLPLEFLYDREAPDDGVGLCKQASQALLTGKCGEDCPTGLKQRTTVCPLGFWGLNRVIERYAHNPEANSPVPDGKDLGLRADRVGNRKRLKVLTSALLGASSRVDEVRDNGVASVKAEMQKHIGLSAVVTTWEKWPEEVKANSPSLLVLLVHTEVNNGQPQMEIGDKQLLKAVHLRQEYVRDPTSNPPPLVLLLGCGTGAPEINVYSFVSQFRDMGAAIVVSTGATILGEHAVDVAIEFLKVLSKLSTGECVSFGDAMLVARRELLEHGLPMVLCLMSYGDADWQIGQAPE